MSLTGRNIVVYLALCAGKGTAASSWSQKCCCSMKETGATPQHAVLQAEESWTAALCQIWEGRVVRRGRFEGISKQSTD